MVVVGWVLIVVGICFVLLGFAGAVRTQFPPPAPKRFADPPNLLASLTDIIRALSAAPPWLAITAVGMIMIVGGAWFAFGLRPSA